MKRDEVINSATDNVSESQHIKVFRNISDKNVAVPIVIILCMNQQPQKDNTFVKYETDFRKDMVNTNSVTLS